MGPRVAEFETRKDDLIVAGFPRSGTTWVQEIVYLLKNPSERKRKAPNDEGEQSILEGGSKDRMEDIFPYLVRNHNNHVLIAKYLF